MGKCRFLLAGFYCTHFPIAIDEYKPMKRGDLEFELKRGGCLTRCKYSGISISRTSNGNKNWFEKSGVRILGVKLTVCETNPREIQGRLEFELSGFLRVRETGFHCNLVPRVSLLPAKATKETLVQAGHVSPRIWEITNKRFEGGAAKCEICLY